MRHPTHPQTCLEHSSPNIALPGANMGPPLPTHAPLSWTVKAVGIGLSLLLAIVTWQWNQAEGRAQDHEARIRALESQSTGTAGDVRHLTAWVTKLDARTGASTPRGEP